MINIFKITTHESNGATPIFPIFVVKSVYLVLILFLLSLIVSSAPNIDYYILPIVSMVLIVSTSFFTWFMHSYCKPKLKRKWMIPIFFFIFFLIIYFLFLFFINELIAIKLSFTTKFLIFIFLGLIVSGIPVFFCNINTLFEKIKKNSDEIEISKNELEYINKQLNPHFLFNNLNNIYATILIDKEMALDYVQKFSDMMRFYHNMFGKEQINLDDEIDYIENYLALEKYKFGDRFTYSFSKNIAITPIEISPFLLSTIIETSIERGLGISGHALVDVNIFSENQMLVLQVVNSIPQVLGKMKKQMLLENLNFKLKLLYQDSYILKIEKDNNRETTTLQLPL